MYPSNQFATDEQITREAVSLAQKLVKRLKDAGMNLQDAIAKVATDSHLPVSEIISLRTRVRVKVSGAVIENLRTLYEAVHEKSR